MITMSDLRKMTRPVKPNTQVKVSVRIPDGTVVEGEATAVSYGNFSGAEEVTIDADKTGEFQGKWVFYPDARIVKLESVSQTVSMLKGVPVSDDLAAAAKDALK